MLNKVFSKSLVKEMIPSVEEIISKVQKKKSIKLIYGETYDKFGLTIDSLKYCFYLSILHRELEKLDIKVESFVIIGDLHSVKNRIVTNKNELLTQADNRLLAVNKIKAKYGLKFTPLLMSSVFKQSGFKNRLSSVSMIFNSTPECREIAEKTVLKNRLTQEEKTGYRYTIEEVSLIMDYDIKVGPPREVFFDKLARLISNKLAKDSLSGIYLKPTYPLGLGFDYFIQHPEVEEYGLTPYKAGSNKLQDNRIILNKDVRRNIDGLIKNTFVPNNLDLPNPLLDLLTITDLAKSCLDKEIVLSDYQKLVKDKNVLASKLKEQLELYIYKPLEY